MAIYARQSALSISVDFDMKNADIMIKRKLFRGNCIMVKILVVDDSPIMRNIVKNTFSDMSVPFMCLEAGNGKQALRLLESNDVSIVFLDWNMPEMDGLDFLKLVRAMPKYTDLPIIMVTSERGKFSVIEALQSGATDYIVKPVKESVFREKVSEILLLG